MPRRKLDDYPEVRSIIDRLKDGKSHDLIALFVPSHDRHQKGLSDKMIWEQQALLLFGRLFTGATAFKQLSGIYQPKRELRPLIDDPTMVQSLTPRENVEDEANLVELAEFCHHMGRKTNQAGVGVVINNYFIDIPIPHGD